MRNAIFSRRIVLFIVLGIASLVALPQVRAEVQKKYVATQNESLVWLERVFQSADLGKDSTPAQETISYLAGFTHPGKKYTTPNRLFLGLSRQFETTSGRPTRRSYLFRDATQMIVTVKGNRSTLKCSYNNDRERNGDNTIFMEKMVADVKFDLLKKMSNAGKVVIGFRDNNDNFLGEYTIKDDNLKELDDLLERISKKDRN